MKKLIFLSFILILLAELTGNSQTTVVRNSKLDSAQALIEKGKICEKELANEKTINAGNKVIIENQDKTITETNATIQEQSDIITDDNRKIKKRNKIIVSESALLTLILIILL